MKLQPAHKHTECACAEWSRVSTLAAASPSGAEASGPERPLLVDELELSRLVAHRAVRTF